MDNDIEARHAMQQAEAGWGRNECDHLRVGYDENAPLRVGVCLECGEVVPLDKDLIDKEKI